MRGAAGRSLLPALAASLVVHAALSALVTLAPQRPVAPPRIEVPEAIPVELVLDDARRGAAGEGLPIVAMRPSLADALLAPTRSGTADAMPVSSAEAAKAVAPPEPVAASPVPSAEVAGIAGLPSTDVVAGVSPPARFAAPVSPADVQRVVAIPSPPAPQAEAVGAGDPRSTQNVASSSPPSRLAALAPHDAAERVEAAALLAAPYAEVAGIAGPRSMDVVAIPSSPSPSPQGEVAIVAALPEPAMTSPAPHAEAVGAADPRSMQDVATSGPPSSLASLAPEGSALRPDDPREAVSALLDGLACARVSASVDLLGGRIALNGHARSPADRQALTRRLAALPGIRAVEDDDLRIVGEPYCQVLTFLDRPELKRSAEQRDDLGVVGAAGQPNVRRLVGGQALDLVLKAPRFDSHIYVDYFSADGQVVHLLPTGSDDQAVRADTAFRLGRDRGRRSFVGPPYGLDVVVVLAVSERLLPEPRPAIEDASAYLAVLDRAIARLRGSGARVEYAYHLLRTSPPSGDRPLVSR